MYYDPFLLNQFIFIQRGRGLLRRKFFLLGISSVLYCLNVPTYAQTVQFDQKKIWQETLQEYSEKVAEAPTPPPEYLRRRWEWLRAQGALVGNDRQESSESLENYLPPNDEANLLTKLQQKLWSALGQASSNPLYETPQQRDQRSAEMDLETQGTPILPTYTHEFVPSITPHKRMTAWNEINKNGALEVNIGGLTEIENIQMTEVELCLSGSSSKEANLENYLSLGEHKWVSPKQLSLNCLRDECLRKGTSCFLGIFSLKDWQDMTQPRGVASVSPEQSLLSTTIRSSVILSQDDAGNFYLSSSPNNALSKLKKIALLISAPRAYFSGSWQADLPLANLAQSSNLSLPSFLRREALQLSSQVLHIDPKQNSFEEMVFKLSDYFRSFKAGQQPDGKSSVYRRLFLSQIGVCRHRSYAFMITARALGIPTRYVTNQVHAFTEILDPSGRWRRVDLGGEGIAPEDQSLTKGIQQDNKTENTLYRPDDGLPRPPGYLAMRHSVQEAQRTLNQQYKPSPFSDRDSSSRLEDGIHQNEQAQNKKTIPNNLMSDIGSSVTMKTGTTHDVSLREESNGLATPENLTNTLEVNAEEQGQGSKQASQTSNDSSIDTPIASPTPQREIMTTQVKHKSDTKQGVAYLHNDCPNPLSTAIKISFRDQELILNRLHKLLDQSRKNLLETTQTKVRLKESKLTGLHRCDIMTLKGRIIPSPKKKSSQLKGTWVIAALKSKSDGKVLLGWGQLDRKGFYRFKVQVPLSISPGDYQLFVYFPKQKGWSEGWSELEE